MLKEGNERVAVTLDGDVLAGLDRMCGLTGLTRSQIIGDCVIQEFTWWCFLRYRFRGAELESVIDKILAGGRFKNKKVCFGLATLRRFKGEWCSEE